MTNLPALVTLHVWGVPPRQLAGSLTRMASQRRAISAFPGVTFSKLLGTGTGETFTVRDADPGHWALLTCWDSTQCATAFERSRSVRAWDASCDERLRVELLPVGSTGRWSTQTPFGDPGLAADGPVAAITRARLRMSSARTFWRSVPPVSRAVHSAAGLALAFGIGEAPVGFQGTFSIWHDTGALKDFAYADPAHKLVMERSQSEGWYAEELFARFAFLASEGTYLGRPLEVGR